METRIDQFEAKVSPWTDRDDFDDDYDEVLCLVKGRDRNHESSVILETENKKKIKNGVSLENLPRSAL